MLSIKTTLAARHYKASKAVRINENDIPGMNLSGTIQNFFNVNWSDRRLSYETKEEVYDRYRKAAFETLQSNPEVLDIIRRAKDGQDIILEVVENRPFQASRRRIFAEFFYVAGVRDIEADKGVDVSKLSGLSALEDVRDGKPPFRDTGFRLCLTPFDADKEIEHITAWIRNWFAENGPKANAVIGISGGKDSTVAAALLVRALGKDRVFGVMMPNGVQPDIADSQRVIQHLGIRAATVNIKKSVQGLYTAITDAVSLAEQIYGSDLSGLSEDARINTPPRIRMTTLYAIAQSLPGGGRVCNTCNLSEDYIGYSTKYGDAAGDFAPLAQYTVTEVLAIGKALGLPEDLVFKTPSDGLCGLSDEDRFGFTYAVLDKFIRSGVCDDDATREKIIRMHELNLHKLRVIPSCPRLEAA